MFPKRRWIWIILAAAFAIRVAVLVKYGPHLSLQSDDEGYVNSAIQLLKTGMLTYHSPTEPTVHIMPGQPVLLAAVFWVFGSGTAGLYAAKLLMILIGVAGIFGLYLLVRLLAGETAGLLAAILFTLSPPHILTDNLLLTETPFTTSFIFLVYFSIRLARRPNMADLYWLLLAYLGCLMFRPTIALYPLLLLGYLLLKKYPVKLLFKQAAIAAVILLAVLAPWWIRNYSLYHTFIPLTGGSGDPLLRGTYQGEGYPNKETYDELVARLNYPSQDAYTVNQVKEQVAKERIRRWWETDPSSLIRSYIWLKPQILWKYAFYELPIFRIPPALLNRIQPAVVISGIAGFLISFAVCSRYRTEILLLTGVLLYFTILYSIYFVYSRYNEPLMPLIFAGIALGLASIGKLGSRLRGRWQ